MVAVIQEAMPVMVLVVPVAMSGCRHCRKLLVGRIQGRWWLVFLAWLGCPLWHVGLPPDASTFPGRPLARVTVALQAFHRHRWRIGACSPVILVHTPLQTGHRG